MNALAFSCHFVGLLIVISLHLILNRKGLSLNALTKQFLGARLDKSKTITCSDWETPILTERQVRYAASDAIAGLCIFERMVEMKLSKEKNAHESLSRVCLEAPPRNLPNSDTAPPLDTPYSDGILTSSEGIQCAMALCKGIVDVAVKNADAQLSASPWHHGSLIPRRTYAYSARTQPLYDNCQLKAPDGTLLANVEKRKMNWYLERNLAGGWGFVFSTSQNLPRLLLVLNY